MRKLMLLFLALVMLCASTTEGIDFEITEVVEIGPAAWIPFTGPLKWSPDGTMLAYFANNYLMISDTLGNSREVMPIDEGIRLYRFEWVTNDQIAINMQHRRRSDSILYSGISLVDISKGLSTIIVEDPPSGERSTLNGVGEVYYEGPFRSFEGNAYYLLKTRTGRRIKYPRSIRSETIDEPHMIDPAMAGDVGSNHIVRRCPTGLYLVALDQTDSTRLADDPDGLGYGVLLSPDMSHILTLNTLVRLSDSKQIDPQQYSGPRPEGTFGCGLLFASFNPIATELLFNQTCDGDHPDGREFVVDRIGTFNYTTNKFTILDTLTGVSNCTAPVYAPNGKRIAFLGNGKAYIINREVK